MDDILSAASDGLPYGAPVERCDYSWLWPNECAHCLGHELPDDVPVQTV